MSGVPIFPSGIVKQYISPIPFGDNTDLTKFTYEQFKGSTKLRTEKFKNILLDSSLKDLKTWIEMDLKNFFPQQHLILALHLLTSLNCLPTQDPTNFF